MATIAITIIVPIPTTSTSTTWALWSVKLLSWTIPHFEQYSCSDSMSVKVFFLNLRVGDNEVEVPDDSKIEKEFFLALLDPSIWQQSHWTSSCLSSHYKSIQILAKNLKIRNFQDEWQVLRKINTNFQSKFNVFKQ